MGTSQSKARFEDYDGFVEKFKPKKTTDDCYTPEPVYEAVAEWVAAEYGVARRDMERPFKPGGDYQAEAAGYGPASVVVDNPPFSILAQICRWYQAHGILYFLFAPTLTLFAGGSGSERCHIAADCDIVYENGANVRTSFVTNLEGCYARTAPSLSRAVNAAAREWARRGKAELPKYVYPYEVLTAARLSYLDKYGVDFRVERRDCVKVGALDMQREFGKSIFGGGLLLSERAAAERAAAERAAAERAAAQTWSLSERERELQRSLGSGDAGR